MKTKPNEAMRQGDLAFQAQLYDDPNPSRRSLHRQRRAWLETKISEHVHPGDMAMEIGIGCGVYTKSMSDRGGRVIAIDINGAFLDGVREISGVTVVEGDATSDLGIRDVEVAVLSEVLEHVPPERSEMMLAEINRALRPGGVLLLTTPQKWSTVERAASLLRLKPFLALARTLYGSADELGHINLLTRADLQKQILKTGFKIEEQAVFGFYLPVIAEFGGKVGAIFLQNLGRVLGRSRLARHLIWTQAYVLRKL